jgi:hypothetical protein
LSYHEISPFFINGKCGVSCDDDAVWVKGMLFKNIDGIDGEWKSKNPVGESKGIVIELEWFFQILIGYSILVISGITVDGIDNIAGHCIN